MSSGKKQQKKRKHQSPPPPSKSQIARRLEKLRSGQKDLWEDDDDDEQPKTTNKKKPYIVLSDSEEERPSSSSYRRLRKSKSRKKTSRNHTENATCLICSILSQLSSHNCCPQHLSSLKNHSHHQQRLPEQVMIIPMTDEIVQRYLDPQQIQHLSRQTSTSPTNKKTSERNISTRKLLNKSTMTLNHSDVQQSSKNIPKSSTKSSQVDIQPLASTIVVESTRSNPATDPSDRTCVTNNVENTTIIDEDQSSIETIDTQQGNILVRPTHINEQIDPWIPISDEIDAALERALDQIDSSFDTPLEFTPATVRRTETEIMAARLPKIPLKEGRFRFGKPIANRTISNAANEYRPSAATQSSPPTSSITPTIVRSPPTAVNVETGSSCQVLNIFDDHNDLFTQDERNLYDYVPITTLSNENRVSVPMTNENSNIEIEIHCSSENQHVTSSTFKETSTPSRISFRLNPDGSRVRISRPPLPPTNHQSPLLTTLRRTSTDVTPIQSNTKQV